MHIGAVEKYPVGCAMIIFGIIIRGYGFDYKTETFPRVAIFYRRNDYVKYNCVFFLSEVISLDRTRTFFGHWCS